MKTFLTTSTSDCLFEIHSMVEFLCFKPQDNPEINATHFPLVTDEKVRLKRMKCNKLTKLAWSRITNPGGVTPHSSVILYS